MNEFKTIILACDSSYPFEKFKKDFEEYSDFLYPSSENCDIKHSFYYKKPRPVKIKVMKHSFCPGARHYYVDIDEENDIVWDKKEKIWRRAIFNEKECGKHFESKFDNVVQVKEYINKIVKNTFNPKIHFLVFLDNDDLLLFWV